MSKLSIAWKNRKKIIQGIWFTLFPNDYVNLIAAKRLQICRKNTCGYHDKLGISEKTFVKGSESCSACGCKLSWATHALSKECGLSELGLPPLWEAKMTEQEEDDFRNKTFIKNE